MFTRKDYLAAAEQATAHRRYHTQFVDSAVIAAVVSRIGRSRILASKDPHLNDIPLHEWDALEPVMRGLCLHRMGDINGYDVLGRTKRIAWSLSDGVCIAKEAAKQFAESTLLKTA